MIFQDPMTSLNPVLTINRQISEALQLHLGMNKDQARSAPIELLQMVGIPNAEERVDQYPHQFSGGMRQRVMIAMALSCNPQAADRRRADHRARRDDPGPDPRPDARPPERARHRRDPDHPLMGVVAGMADRIQVMYAGHIVETASTEEIFANPRHPYTRRPAEVDPAPGRRAQGEARADPRPAARPDRPAGHVPVRAALQLRAREVRAEEPAAARGRAGPPRRLLVLGRGQQGRRPGRDRARPDPERSIGMSRLPSSARRR